MNGSLKIGTAFGIPIRIHWTFAILPTVMVALGTPFAAAVLLLIVLFGCVFLHELGHSLVARGFGIRVLDISFWPLGGMARMSEIPESPKIEGLVAIAGPAVNFALAGLGVFALVLTRTQVITYPVQISQYFGSQSTFWAKISAMSVLGTLPVFFAVAAFQRYLVRGISLGAVKG